MQWITSVRTYTKGIIEMLIFFVFYMLTALFLSICLIFLSERLCIALYQVTFHFNNKQ